MVGEGYVVVGVSFFTLETGEFKLKGKNISQMIIYFQGKLEAYGNKAKQSVPKYWC